MSDGGKGDTQRPKQVSDEQYAQRWELIFGTAEVDEEDPESDNKELRIYF